MATLGDRARQQGSLVEPDPLRCAFARFTALTTEQLTAIEKTVNGHVLDDRAVRAWYADHVKAEAEAAGAIALFGEKYGKRRIRIADIGDFSRELCGGAHVAHDSQVSAFRLLSAPSIGSNVPPHRSSHRPRRHPPPPRTPSAICRTSFATPPGPRPSEAPGALRKRLDALAQTTPERLRAAKRRTHAVQLTRAAALLGAGGTPSRESPTSPRMNCGSWPPRPSTTSPPGPRP